MIVGPGRVGSALGRALSQRGVDVLGYVGRNPQHTAAALRFCGTGSELQWSDLQRAHVVLFAVGDGELQAAVGAAAEAARPRSCSLWLHTSGRHDLSVFDVAVPAGIRRGSLHPLVPFPDPATGLRGLAGAPAVVDGDLRSRRLLRRLCTWLGLVPIVGNGGDRALYHAACALAANGLTALFAVAARVLAAARVGPVEAHRRMLEALLAAALRTSQEHGAAAALSGPVRRGDTATVAAHLAALGAGVPEAIDCYRALMLAAVDLAEAQGVSPSSAAAMRSVLAPHEHPPT
ncbi:MAG: DUF2520 domain-containing protein [Planctomycetota bacterium]